MGRLATVWRGLGEQGPPPCFGWIELSYRTSLYERLSRPLLSMSTPAGIEEFALPAGLFGTADWVGYVPANVTQLTFSGAPVHGLRWRRLSIATVIARAVARDPRGAVDAARLALHGRRAAARDALRAACGSTGLGDYDRWRRRHLRPLDPTGLEAPSPDWGGGPEILVVLEEGEDRARSAVEATKASLREQSYRRWSLLAVPSLERLTLASLERRVPANGFVTLLRAGDVLAPYALAVVVQHVLRCPDDAIIYADEDRIDAAGRHCDPQLKPDWSPIHEATSPYVGGALFLAASMAAQFPALRLLDLAQGRVMPPLSDTTRGVGHVRRITLTRPLERTGSVAPAQVQVQPTDRSAADATIIIPTKDRPDLLSECLSSLRATTGLRHDVIVVDNGSTSRDARAFHDILRQDGRVRLIERPSPFNFSRLCNEGAAEATGRLLVFLNDDTRVLRPDWLNHLAHWACRDDCGAVGAKLLYPSGRVQHAGMALRVRWGAVHTDGGAPAGDAGYLRRLAGAREVSAVTGACLAVEASKFATVGGFDADCFPVEFSDVDLCLRLDAKGWKTVIAAGALLMHRESASRGPTVDGLTQYAHEHREFRKRWGHKVLDDPYHHPALALRGGPARLDG